MAARCRGESSEFLGSGIQKTFTIFRVSLNASIIALLSQTCPTCPTTPTHDRPTAFSQKLQRRLYNLLYHHAGPGVP